MKRTYYKILGSVIAIALLISCEKEIKFKDNLIAPKMVMNSFLASDSIMRVYLTKSKFFLSNENTFEYINGADVSVYINEEFKEKLTYTSKGWYISTLKPKIGDTVKIIVKTQEFGNTESVTVIPEKPNILSTESSYKVISSSLSTDANNDTLAFYERGELNIKAKIKDAGRIRNYYRVSVKEQRISYETGNLLFESFIPFSLDGFGPTDPIDNLIDIAEQAESSVAYEYLLSDELFDGKDFTLNLRLPVIKDFFKQDDQKSGELAAPENHRTKVYHNFSIYFQNISRDMYLYLKSKNMSEEVIDGTFSEPIQLYNNINNGLGILGSYTNKILFVSTLK